jgi:hypothetical protein
MRQKKGRFPTYIYIYTHIYTYTHTHTQTHTHTHTVLHTYRAITPKGMKRIRKRVKSKSIPVTGRGGL